MMSKEPKLNTLLASARRLVVRRDKKATRKSSTATTWQDDAWEMYDLVGEQRFLASTLAGRMSQARFYVGNVPDDPGEQPVPTEDENLIAVLDSVGGGAGGLAQLVHRLGINLFVAGDGWLAGIPKSLLPENLRMEGDNVLSDDPGAISDFDWRMLSINEVTMTASQMVRLDLGEDDQIEVSPDDLFLIRVWRPHPRKWWEADSPTRSSLPVLRELVGLTMHISAQIDSRLAGAGMLIVPQSAQRALQQAAGVPDDGTDEDQFTEALIEAMLTPINDRASASALVPLVVTVPDDVTDNFNYINFSKPLDAEAREMRDEAIRRLALGQDAPPELLLGTGGMNHWGAWLVREDVVTTHIEPPLALICDALTTQYLWPVLIDQGYTPEQAREHVIWYDVSDLITRPNRSADALELHTRDVLSDTALRTATGFDESDAPESSESTDPVVAMAMDMARSTPSLVQEPGLPELVRQIREVLGNLTPAPTDPGTVTPNTGELPATDQDDPEPTGPED